MDLVQYQLHVIDQQRNERQNFFRDLLRKSPLLLLAAGLMTGMVLQDRLALSITFWLTCFGIILSAAAAALLLVRTHRYHIMALLAVLSFLCLGGVRLIHYSSRPPDDIASLVGSERTLATLKGYVVSQPRIDTHPDWDFADFGSTDPASSFYLEVDEVKTTDGWHKSAGTLRMQVNAPALDVRLGDHVLAYCWLDRFKPSSNPGQFDVAAYLARRNVYLAAFVKTRHGIERLTQGSGTFLDFQEMLRRQAKCLLLGKTTCDSETESMLAALLLGERVTISAAVNYAFYRTGLLHILALSGGHVALLIALCWWLCKTAGLPKRLRACVCLLVIIWFTLVVPPYAPVLRASIIGAFFCVSIMLGRTPNSINTLALAAIVLVLVWPLQFYEAGWQLSFACVLGILLFTKAIEVFLHDCCNNFCHEDSPRKLVRFIKRSSSAAITALAAGLAATIGGAGILLYQFYNITPLGALWTVLVMPLVSIILVTGFFGIALSALLPTIGAAFNWVALIASGLFTELVKFFSGIDGTQVLIGSIPIWLAVLYYAVLIFGRYVHLRNNLLKKGIVITGLVILISAISYYKWTRISHGHLELTCLSVGHGQAIIAQLPGKVTLLFDAGSMSVKDAGSRIILPCLNYGGISRIESILASHYDIDHINAIPEVIEQRLPAHVFTGLPSSGNFAEPQTAAFLKEVLHKNHIETEPPPAQLPLNSAASVSLLWPRAADCNSTRSANDLAQVYLIEYAGKRILLCSDIENYAQQRIVELYPDLQPDFVVMPHHGSERTMSAQFIQYIESAVWIYSCNTAQYERLAPGPKHPRSFYTSSDGAITLTITPDGRTKVTAFAQKKTLP